MIATTVTAKITRKVNLGDYSSIEFEAQTWAQVEEGETDEDAQRQLLANLAKVIGEKSRPFMRNGAETVTTRTTEKFGGRTVDSSEMAAALGI